MATQKFLHYLIDAIGEFPEWEASTLWDRRPLNARHDRFEIVSDVQEVWKIKFTVDDE